MTRPPIRVPYRGPAEAMVVRAVTAVLEATVARVARVVVVWPVLAVPVGPQRGPRGVRVRPVVPVVPAVSGVPVVWWSAMAVPGVRVVPVPPVVPVVPVPVVPRGRPRVDRVRPAVTAVTAEVAVRAASAGPGAWRRRPVMSPVSAVAVALGAPGARPGLPAMVVRVRPVTLRRPPAASEVPGVIRVRRAPGVPAVRLGVRGDPVACRALPVRRRSSGATVGPGARALMR